MNKTCYELKIYATDYCKVIAIVLDVYSCKRRVIIGSSAAKSKLVHTHIAWKWSSSALLQITKNWRLCRWEIRMQSPRQLEIKNYQTSEQHVCIEVILYLWNKSLLMEYDIGTLWNHLSYCWQSQLFQGLIYEFHINWMWFRRRWAAKESCPTNANTWSAVKIESRRPDSYENVVCMWFTYKSFKAKLQSPVGDIAREIRVLKQFSEGNMSSSERKKQYVFESVVLLVESNGKLYLHRSNSRYL